MNNTVEPRPWMFEAAYKIDAECGLGRFDHALTRTAQIIAECYSASQLRHFEQSDAEVRVWWQSLTPTQKADHLRVTGETRELFLKIVRHEDTV